MTSVNSSQFSSVDGTMDIDSLAFVKQSYSAVLTGLCLSTEIILFIDYIEVKNTNGIAIAT